MLEVQPRLASGGSGKTSDEIVYELAESILSKLPLALDMEKADKAIFEVRVQSNNVVGQQLLDYIVRYPAKRPNIVNQHWMATLDAQRNVPTMLANICWMAMLDARIIVLTLLANICWMVMLDAPLNVPTLLANIC